MRNLIEEYTDIKDCEFGNYCWIRLFSRLDKVRLNSDIFIGFRSNIINTEVENGVQIASQVEIGGLNLKTKIENGTWIGARSIIKEGVIVGHHSVIGANTVIDFDVPPNTIVYGNPCVIKSRIYYKNGEPNFRRFLLKMIDLKKKGMSISQNDKGNFITADINGFPKKIGVNNIIVGKKNGDYGGLIFGHNVEVNDSIILEGAGGIIIGDNCKICKNVTIISNTHNYKESVLPMVLQPVKIGKNVVIKENSLVLGGVTIPDNTVIKNNSFILK